MNCIYFVHTQIAWLESLKRYRLSSNTALYHGRFAAHGKCTLIFPTVNSSWWKQPTYTATFYQGNKRIISTKHCLLVIIYSICKFMFYPNCQMLKTYSLHKQTCWNDTKYENPSCHEMVRNTERRERDVYANSSMSRKTVLKATQIFCTHVVICIQIAQPVI